MLKPACKQHKSRFGVLHVSAARVARVRSSCSANVVLLCRSLTAQHVVRGLTANFNYHFAAQRFAPQLNTGPDRA
jgi:hypothetical protein